MTSRATKMASAAIPPTGKGLLPQRDYAAAPLPLGVQLSDADIRIWMMDGKLVIRDFREENLTPNGYDLTVAEILLPATEGRTTEGTARIPPRTWFLVSTAESLALGPRLAGDLWIRTTWARQGVLPAFGKVDAGFRGTLTLSAYNASEGEVELPVGETFAQIAFHELRSRPAGTYEERSGSYQDQTGVTPARRGGRTRSGPRKGSSRGPPGR